MYKKILTGIFLFSLFYLFVISWSCDTGVRYDLAILNGRVISGDGNLWYRADLGIKGDKIIYIGKIQKNSASETIDVADFYVCPGFIDIHNHSDRKITEIPTADNYLLQGVTTVVGGNCGGHKYPLEDLFEKIENQGTAVNFCCLIGHNTIRRKIPVPAHGNCSNDRH